VTIEIDGGWGEGGGQIIRIAVGLSGAMGKDIVIYNIRKGRKKPGLRAQHLAGVRVVGEMCDADIKGLEIGSTEVEFRPRNNTGGHFEIDIHTAGSISLVLQSCMIPALLAKGPTELIIWGGTDVPWSPPIDYLRLVLLPLLHKMGASAEIAVKQRGYYPSGGGKVSVQIEPVGELCSIDLSQRGKLLEITGVVACRNLPAHISDRVIDSAIKELTSYPMARIKSECSRGPSTGVSFVMAARYENTVLGANCLGEKGLPAEKVGERTAQDLEHEMCSGAVIDDHASDQIIPYLFLARGKSRFGTGALSLHAKTSIWVTKQFIERDIEIVEEEKTTSVTVD